MPLLVIPTTSKVVYNCIPTVYTIVYPQSIQTLPVNELEINGDCTPVTLHRDNRDSQQWGQNEHLPAEIYSIDNITTLQQRYMTTLKHYNITVKILQYSAITLVK